MSDLCMPARLWLRLADFAHPREVLAAEELEVEEKRQILACWASDAHVPDSHPALRWMPGTPGPVPLRSVLQALDSLDHPAAIPSAVVAAFGAGRRRAAPYTRNCPE